MLSILALLALQAATPPPTPELVVRSIGRINAEPPRDRLEIVGADTFRTSENGFDVIAKDADDGVVVVDHGRKTFFRTTRQEIGDFMAVPASATTTALPASLARGGRDTLVAGRATEHYRSTKDGAAADVWTAPSLPYGRRLLTARRLALRGIGRAGQLADETLAPLADLPGTPLSWSISVAGDRSYSENVTVVAVEIRPPAQDSFAIPAGYLEADSPYRLQGGGPSVESAIPPANVKEQ